MAYEQKISISEDETVTTKIVSDEELGLKISSISNNPDWLIIEDINNDEDDECYAAIPKSRDAIEMTIELLEEARDKFFK